MGWATLARVRTTLAVTLVAAAACGGSTEEAAAPPPPPSPSWTSGSRLRARVHDAGEGAVRFVAWHDSELGVDCSFVKADDGALRCLPNVELYPTDGLFADPECTLQAIEYGPSCEPDPRWVRAVMRPASSSDPCDFRRAVLELTRASGTYRLVNGACKEQRPSTTVYAAKPIAASRFVKGELRTEPCTSRIAASVVVSEDGARETAGLVDVERGAPCTVPSDDRHCLPFVEGSKVSTNGASCTLDAIVATCTAKPPTMFVEHTADPADVCGQKVRVRTLGKGEVRPYWNPSYDGPCRAATSPGLVLPLGADVALDAFPPIGEAAAGRGRVKLTYLASDGRGVVARAFRDDELGECEARRDANGTLRCMPDAFFGTRRRYADPACSVRVLPSFDGVCDEKGRTFVGGSASEDAALCHEEVFRLGKRVAARAYERDANGACVASEVVGAYFEITPVGPEVLAPVTERIE